MTAGAALTWPDGFLMALLVSGAPPGRRAAIEKSIYVAMVALSHLLREGGGEHPWFDSERGALMRSWGAEADPVGAVACWVVAALRASVRGGVIRMDPEDEYDIRQAWERARLALARAALN